MKNQLKKSKPTIVSIIFKLFNGKIVEIKTSDSFLITTVDNYEQLDLKDTDEVFKITDTGYEL